MGEKKQKGGKPPLSVWRTAGAVLAGGLGGAAVSLTFIGFRSEFDVGFAFLAVGLKYFFGTSMGLLLGCTTGVYLVGSLGDERGSFWATLGGSILGVVLLLPLVGLLTDLLYAGRAIVYLDGLDRFVFLFTLFALLSISPTIAFNLTHRRK